MADEISTNYAEAPPAPPVTGKPCEGCGVPTLFERLKPSRAGDGRALCPTCYAQSNADRVDSRHEALSGVKRQQSVERMMRFTELARAADEQAAPTIHAALNALLDEAGGLEEFAATMWGILEELRASGGSRVTILNTMVKLLRLIADATPKVQRDVNFREMSDQELAVTYRLAAERAFALKLAQKHPAWGAELTAALKESEEALLACEPEEAHA